MANHPELTFFHAPQSRSGAVRVLLEELGVAYHLHIINLKAGTEYDPAYLAINPMGKVPALKDGDAVITENVAIHIYLPDRSPEADLAPVTGDPLRGPYLRWLAYYGSCFEPALMDRYLKREPAQYDTSPYGDFDTMFKILTDHLEQEGPWMLGERFSSADVLWGTSLDWTSRFGLIPAHPAIATYIDRYLARPAVQRAYAADAELAAAQEAEAAV